MILIYFLAMYPYQSITTYHQDLLDNKTTCVAVVTDYLNKIKTHTSLNAFVQVYANEAIEMATQLDQKRQSGATPKKLHGVVIGIKDVICYKNHPVTAASAMLKDFISPYNASAIQFLLDEEAIIIGSCNCDEFAMGSSNENSIYGNVRNAADPTKVPGGSSGGSAVAVQADLCMVSLGSDTGGSVRQPADFCGVIGLKPSYGCISRYGLIAYASSFDQIGIFGKSIDDVALILETISQTDNYDSTMNKVHYCQHISQSIPTETTNQKRNIAYFKQVLDHQALDKEIQQNIYQTIDQLKNDGHNIIAIDFDYLDYIVPAYYVLTTAEASSNLARYDGIRYGYNSKSASTELSDYYIKNRSEGFGKEVKKRIMLGNFVLSSGYYDAYYNKAQQVRQLLVEKINSVFESCDLIIMPNSPTTAFALGEKNQDPIAMYLSDIYTVFANLTGIPAIALPLYKHSNGMPYGLQLLGKRNDEQLVLQFSKSLISAH
jgi:aspartyl-tRNA(Asn)/glutamyl-tRNA(Gln) amidotransferase subunit A